MTSENVATVEQAGGTVEHVLTPEAARRTTTIHVGLPLVIILSASFHVVTGACLIYRNANANLLLLSGLDGPRHFFGLSANALGAVLIVLGVMALIGVALERRIDIRIVTFLVIGQYSLMLWSLVGDILVIVEGVNPTTGVPVNRSIFIQVLSLVMIVAIVHTFSFIERYVLRWLR